MTTHQNDHTFAFDPNNSLTNNHTKNRVPKYDHKITRTMQKLERKLVGTEFQTCCWQHSTTLPAYSTWKTWQTGENVVTDYRQSVNMLLIVKLLPSL